MKTCSFVLLQLSLEGAELADGLWADTKHSDVLSAVVASGVVSFGCAMGFESESADPFAAKLEWTNAEGALDAVADEKIDTVAAHSLFAFYFRDMNCFFPLPHIPTSFPATFVVVETA